MEEPKDKEEQMADFALRWGKIIDNFRYMSIEHKHKEKEYGIRWRTQFKTYVNEQYNKLIER